VVDVWAVAWLDDAVISAANHLVDKQQGQWGPLRRR